jgi:hypothetical protein
VDWTKIAEQFGITATLLAFFVGWVYRILNNAIRRLNAIEDYQRDKLEGLVVNSTAAITANTETMKELCAQLRDSARG